MINKITMNELLISAVLVSLNMSGCSCSKKSDITVVNTPPIESTPISNLTAASGLTWTSAVYQPNASVSWVLGTGSNIASQKIQYYSDGVCGTMAGLALDILSSTTTGGFVGVNATTYSFKITTKDINDNTVTSACSPALTIDTSLACVGPRLTNSPYADGSGTALDPYMICTPAQMNAIGLTSSDWSKNFMLMKDIDLSGYTGTAYNMIGNSTTKFTGTFDGHSHTISNFTRADTSSANVGLFGFVSGVNSLIKNIFLTNINLSAQGSSVVVGGIVGTLQSGKILNAKVLSGSIVQTSSLTFQIVGGVVGYLYGGATASNLVSAVNFPSNHKSHNLGGVVGNAYNATITSASYSGAFATGVDIQVGGGIVGDAASVTIDSSSNSASLYADFGLALGGIVGDLSNNSNIIKSYSTGSVTGWVSYEGGLVGILATNNGYGVLDSYSTGAVVATSSSNLTGGLIGYVYSTGRGVVIKNSYATGLVTTVASGYGGGLVGDDSSGGMNSGIYTGCFWDDQVNATRSGIGHGPVPAGVIGSHSANMKDPSIFTGAGWLNTVWNLTTPGSYLKLLWQP